MVPPRFQHISSPFLWYSFYGAIRYGQGLSESVLGDALADVPRESYFIGTKVGRYEKNVLGMFDFSRERTLSSVSDSLLRLKLRYVDIIQVRMSRVNV